MKLPWKSVLTSPLTDYSQDLLSMDCDIGESPFSPLRIPLPFCITGHLLQFLESYLLKHLISTVTYYSDPLWYNSSLSLGIDFFHSGSLKKQILQRKESTCARINDGCGGCLWAGDFSHYPSDWNYPLEDWPWFQCIFLPWMLKD